MNKLANMIESLPKEDVMLIKKDLDAGNIQRAITDRLSELDMPQKVCPTCGSAVSEDAPFVLYFGQTIRQKARFDALDCLEYFLKELR